jgi:hypothetical protein
MDRRYSSRISPDSFEISPDSFEDPLDERSLLESRMAAKPELTRGWDYRDLEEKYPVAPIQVRRQRERESALRKEDLQYKMLALQERENELNLRKIDRDLDMYDARLAREDAMLEQVPLARNEFRGIDPRNPDFIQKSIDVQNKYPMAFENKGFVDNIYKPMLDRHRSLTSRTEKAIPLEEYEVASGILQDEETNNAAKGGDRVARAKILSAQRTAKMFEQQEGLSFDDDQQSPTQPVNQTEIEEPSSDQIYSDAMEAIRRRPDKKDVINRRLIEMGLSPIE